MLLPAYLKFSRSLTHITSHFTLWFFYYFFLFKALIFFPLSSPPEGIQAPQSAISQPAAAFGHHWVSSYSHIRQTVCRDGLRHLGWRRETCFFSRSQKPYVSLTFPHSPTHSAFLYVVPCMFHIPFIQWFSSLQTSPSSFPVHLFITLKKKARKVFFFSCHDSLLLSLLYFLNRLLMYYCHTCFTLTAFRCFTLSA